MKFASPGPWFQPKSHGESIFQNIGPISRQLANGKYPILPKLKILASFGWAETSDLSGDRFCVKATSATTTETSRKMKAPLTSAKTSIF